MRNASHLTKQIYTFIFFVFCIGANSCRKSIEPNNTLSEKAATDLFYSQTTSLNSALTGLVKSFQKQRTFNKNLVAFIEKNGVPVWDKTIYQLGSSAEIGGNSSAMHANSEVSKMTAKSGTDTSKGFFFVADEI